MNRLDRITAILIQLQTKRIVTSGEIAERFEISKRTVYRDIKTLQLAGVPIGAEEGKGYFIVDGYKLPPVMFTKEEAYAMVSIERILNTLNEESLKKHYTNALHKIKSVLKQTEKDKIEYLDSKIGLFHWKAPASNHLTEVQSAITDHFVLNLMYHSGSKNETTNRTVLPYGLFFNGLSWYVIGYCKLRKDIREFRMDRIVSLEITDDTFFPDSDFKLDDYLAERSKKSLWDPTEGNMDRT